MLVWRGLGGLLRESWPRLLDGWHSRWEKGSWHRTEAVCISKRTAFYCMDYVHGSPHGWGMVAPDFLQVGFRVELSRIRAARQNLLAQAKKICFWVRKPPQCTRDNRTARCTIFLIKFSWHARTPPSIISIPQWNFLSNNALFFWHASGGLRFFDHSLGLMSKERWF
jgi:hypothetical protein